jgi:hypothetical protein
VRAQWPDSVICRELVIAILSSGVALASAGRERLTSRPVRTPYTLSVESCPKIGFGLREKRRRNYILSTSPQGTDLANTALLVSIIRGLVKKGLIDQADARLWLSNAATFVADTDPPQQAYKQDALTLLRDKLPGFLD